MSVNTKMTANRIRPWAPPLVSGLIAISAVTLFIHTASSRHLAAQARRHRVEEQRVTAPVTESRDAGAASTVNSLRQGLSPAERRLAMGKRLDSVRDAAHSLDQTRALLALIREFEPGDFALAMDNCRAGGAQASDRGESETILEEWSRRDPLAALAYAGQDARMKASILQIWAETNPEAALSWARQNADDGSGDRSGEGLAGAVIAGIANTNPKLAIEHLAELSPEGREKTLTTILRAGDAASTKAVVEWIGEIEDPAERAGMVKMAYENWGTYANLDQKYRLFEAYPEALSGQWIQHLFGDWIDIDPPAAMAAIERMPEGKLRQDSLTNAMETYVSSGDLKGVVELVEKHRDEVSDEMIVGAIEGSPGGDPNVTLQQAALIGDAGIRDNAVAGVLNRWADTDPEAARAWMDGHEASAKVREKFARLAKRGNYFSHAPSKAKIVEALGR